MSFHFQLLKYQKRQLSTLTIALSCLTAEQLWHRTKSSVRGSQLKSMKSSDLTVSLGKVTMERIQVWIREQPLVTERRTSRPRPVIAVTGLTELMVGIRHSCIYYLTCSNCLELIPKKYVLLPTKTGFLCWVPQQADHKTPLITINILLEKKSWVKFSSYL